MHYIIGLGSNLGSREASLAAALDRIAATSDLHVVRVSSIYDSAPLGPPQPRYLNAAARIATTYAADALLDVLLAIEARLGRVRRERWGARTIDLDILWAEEPFTSERLTIPHPELSRRAFALAPLLDVAPELTAKYGPRLVALGGVPARIDPPEAWLAAAGTSGYFPRNPRKFGHG